MVLDASAVLAVLLSETGSDRIVPHLGNAHAGTINLSESMTKLIEHRVSAEEAEQQILRLRLAVHDFDFEQARCTAALRLPTKRFGLSLGDRACLALAQHLDMPILTSDRRMAEAKVVLGIDIRMIR